MRESLSWTSCCLMSARACSVFWSRSDWTWPIGSDFMMAITWPACTLSPSRDLTSTALPADGVETARDCSASGPTRPGESTVLYTSPRLTSATARPISCFCASSRVTRTGATATACGVGDSGRFREERVAVSSSGEMAIPLRVCNSQAVPDAAMRSVGDEQPVNENDSRRTVSATDALRAGAGCDPDILDSSLGAVDQRVERRQDDKGKGGRRQQAAYDYDRKRSLALRADAGGHRRRKNAEHGHGGGHQHRAHAAESALVCRLGRGAAFGGAEVVYVANQDDAVLNRDPR